MTLGDRDASSPSRRVADVEERVGTDMALHRGWRILFQQYVHMYCHSLTAMKGGRHSDVPCEDTPDGFLGVWPHGLDLEERMLDDLLNGLREWADSSGRVYRIYTSADAYLTNESQP